MLGKEQERGNVQQGTALTGQVNDQARRVSDIVGEAVNQPTAGEQEVERLRQILRDTRIRSDTEVPPEEYALEVDGKGFFALRDIHAIKAKQKGGKTTALKVMLAALLTGQTFRVRSLLRKPRIVYFDTEQSRTDTKLILEDVAQMTGLDPLAIDGQVVLQSLRRCDHEQLPKLLRVAVEDEQPGMVLIDGIVEFVASFNDEAQAKQLIHDLLVLCDEHDCAIVCVLHTNKADEDHNMRGHLGTMLAQKAGTVLECRKQNGIITVSCSDSRHAEMPDWSIRYDEDGHIVDADEQHRMMQEQRKAAQMQKRQEATAEKQKERLETCLRVIRDKGGSVSRRQLTEILVKMFGRERSTVSGYISIWLKNKAIVEVNDMIQVFDEPVLPF